MSCFPLVIHDCFTSRKFDRSKPKLIVNVKIRSELVLWGESWITNPYQYPSLHLDCLAIKAAGVGGTWGVTVFTEEIGEGGSRGSE
ncbi:hypothetical protein AVEN_60145-1 [Araneus ventricosus]|uniref:Uncharacterized protein n=1 Tax=Araneus ventricosus TaxID=182803 RepID=A0A4Y2RDL6_ARAVE|nr:hypothetical protein AVEN_60145-1 [Araneus ventricosus]